MNILADLLNGFIEYDNTTIMVIYDKDNEPWFRASKVARVLEYVKTDQAIRDNIDSEYRKPLSEITSNVYINMHPDSIFINEAGLYQIAFNGNTKKAKEFRKWVTFDVLPTIRKTGMYKLHESHTEEMRKVNEKLNKQNTTIEILLKNQQKERFPLGGIFYIFAPINKTFDNLYKIGVTNDLNERLNSYNTGMADKLEIIWYKEVKQPVSVELNVKSLLYEFRYKSQWKEVFKCSLEHIIKTVEQSINVINDTIETVPHRLSQLDEDSDNYGLPDTLTDSDFSNESSEENNNNNTNEHYKHGDIRNTLEYKNAVCKVRALQLAKLAIMYNVPVEQVNELIDNIDVYTEVDEFMAK